MTYETKMVVRAFKEMERMYTDILGASSTFTQYIRNRVSSLEQEKEERKKPEKRGIYLSIVFNHGECKLFEFTWFNDPQDNESWNVGTAFRLDERELAEAKRRILEDLEWDITHELGGVFSPEASTEYREGYDNGLKYALSRISLSTEEKKV